MYVKAPIRRVPGTTDAREPRRWWDSWDHSTIEDAKNGVGTVVNNDSIIGRRVRFDLKKGVIGYKVYKPTDYYSLSVETSSPVVWDAVVQTSTTPPRYGRNVRPINFGYIGSGGTGADRPWEFALKESTFGHPAAAFNRSLIFNLENKVKTDAANKARRQSIDLAESLVDIDKTAMMVVDRLSSVLRAWESVRKRDINGALKHLGISGNPRYFSRDIAKLWLELQYGWKPLLSDIHDGIKTLNEGFDLPSGVFSVRRRDNTTLPGFEPYLISQDGWNKVWRGDYSFVARADVEVKYHLKISDALLAYLKSLSLENPAYIAWVSLPFSFVIDWLVPVGDYLSAISAPLGLTFVDGYISTRTSSRTSYSCSFGDSKYPVVWNAKGPAKAYASHVELRRVSLTAFPPFTPYFRLPFSNSQRVANALALFETLRHSR